jgi:hypothetical protein
MPSTHQVVHGPSIDGGSSVFVEREFAEELAHTRRVLATATTWGEVRTGLSAERFAECLEGRYPETSTPPSDDSPFAPGDLLGYLDGDWPEWPATEQLSWWMPAEVQALGRRQPTVLNEDILDFDPADDDAVIAAPQRAGYEVVRDDALVAAACGMA